MNKNHAEDQQSDLSFWCEYFFHPGNAADPLLTQSVIPLEYQLLQKENLITYMVTFFNNPYRAS